MKGFKVNGEWVEEPNIIKEEIKKHFKNHFEETEKLILNLEGIPFPSITKDDNIELIASSHKKKFSEQSVN